jgi:hypothetical protein
MANLHIRLLHLITITTTTAIPERNSTTVQNISRGANHPTRNTPEPNTQSTLPFPIKKLNTFYSEK